MTARTYFRLCLVLPLLVTAIAWLFGHTYPALMLVMSSLIAGAPYIPFAVAVWVLLGRTPHSLAIPKVIVYAPLLFIPVEAVALLIWKMIQDGVHWDVLYSLVLLPLIAIFTIGFGYLYVGLACLPYGYLRRAGYIRAPDVG